MRKFIWQVLTINFLSMTIAYTDLAFGYLCTDELRVIVGNLRELRDLLNELPESVTLPTNLIENVFSQLDLVETLLDQAEVIYHSHSLMLLNECEVLVSTGEYSLAHREQPLMILNIRRYIVTIRTLLHSLVNASVIDLY